MDAATYYHPSFYRGMSQEEILAIPRKSRLELEAEETMKNRKETSKKRKSVGKDDSKNRPVKVMKAREPMIVMPMSFPSTLSQVSRKQFTICWRK